MSMPTIPKDRDRPTKCEVVVDLLKSVAMEETALAHLVWAEAGKIRAFVGRRYEFPLNPTAGEVVAFNAQVFQLMDTVVMKEWLLLRKMRDVIQLGRWFCDDDNNHSEE